MGSPVLKMDIPEADCMQIAHLKSIVQDTSHLSEHTEFYTPPFYQPWLSTSRRQRKTFPQNGFPIQKTSLVTANDQNYIAQLL